jgi:hypothetical protein
MQAQVFQEFLSDHQQVRDALQRASEAAPAKSFGLVTDMAALVLLFPVVRFIVIDIGLPWLTTLKKYSEVERRRVEAWIDRHAQDHGLDPDELEVTSRKLMQELEQTNGVDARGQWQRLQELLKTEPND